MWKYAEDIIEFIAGYRDKTGRLLNPWNREPSPISLARYDVSILDSLAIQTVENNRAYTQKQSQLALKIITKYRKQLAKLNVMVEQDHTAINFRLGIRYVDQSRSIKLKDGRIEIRFPYNPVWIKQLKTLASNGYGSVQFDYENKIWNLAITEYNINFAVAFGQSLEFDIDPELQILAKKIIEVESQPYCIELQQHNDKLTVTNAPESLIAYLNNMGGLTINNLYTLVDLSSVLGYTVAEELLQQLSVPHPELLLLSNRRITVERTDYTLDDIVQYAIRSNRLPVYVYDTGTPKRDTEHIVYLNTKKQNKFHEEIKLMVTMTGVLVGFRKQDWIRRAEKVICLK